MMNGEHRPIGWRRHSHNNYEVSSRGDQRFSALFARLKDGRTIEEAYQLDVKGYRVRGNKWIIGKGKPPLLEKSKDTLFTEYVGLWVTWCKENPELVQELRELSDGKYLTDKFATTQVNQAHALYLILTTPRLLS